MKKMDKDIEISTRKFEEANETARKETYLLRLFVAGSSPKSARAISNIRDVCEKYLKGKYELEVIDLYQNPIMASEEQIIAAPTLIKKLPLPLRRIIGDLSDSDKLIVGLDLLKIKNEKKS